MRVILARYDIYDFIGIPSRYDRNEQGGKAKYFPFFVFSSIVLTCVLFWLLASCFLYTSTSFNSNQPHQDFFASRIILT